MEYTLIFVLPVYIYYIIYVIILVTFTLSQEYQISLSFVRVENLATYL